MIRWTKGGLCVHVRGATDVATHGTLWMWSGEQRQLASVELYWDRHGNCRRALCTPNMEYIFRDNEREFFDLDPTKQPETEE